MFCNYNLMPVSNSLILIPKEAFSVTENAKTHDQHSETYGAGVTENAKR